MSPPSSEPSTLDFRKVGRRLAIAMLLAMATFAALSAYGDYQEITDRLRNFSWGWFVLALALSAGNYAVRAVRWQYYLRRVSVRVPWTESVLVFMAGFVMTITPGKVGEVFKSFLLKWTRDAPLRRTTPIVVAERVTDLAGMVILAAWGATLLPGGWWLASLSIGLTAFGMAAVAYRPLGETMIRWLSRIPKLARFRPKLTDAYDSLRVLVEPQALSVGVLLSTVAWFLQVVGVAAVALGATGVALDLRVSSLAYCGSMVAGVLALVPGGIGITEAGMTGFLQTMGNESLTPGLAALVTILARVATLWWAVLLGWVALGAHRAITRWAPMPDEIPAASEELAKGRSRRSVSGFPR